MGSCFKVEATYQVAPGTLVEPKLGSKFLSISQNENEQSIWDDTYFTVNNVPTILTGLEINTHITRPSPEGYAMIWFKCCSWFRGRFRCGFILYLVQSCTYNGV